MRHLSAACSRLFFLCSLFVGLSISFLLSGSFAMASPLYSIQNLGSLSGESLPLALNNSGAAVGYVIDTQGLERPVTFSAGGINWLGGVGEASGINNAGDIAGTTYTNDTPYATVWSNGQATTLTTSSYGTAINSSKELVGEAETANGTFHAFSSTNGSITDLGTLGGSWSSASAINNRGQIVGTSLTANNTFNAFFSNGSSMQDIGTLGGRNSYAMSINDSGEVVGNAQNSAGYSHAFAWQNGRMTDLGTLGGAQSYAYGVNSSGTVVGYSWTANNTTDGFVYLNGAMLDLNSLLTLGSGWDIDAAYSINDSGDILAAATYAGQFYAVELTPTVTSTPEPAVFLLVGIGLIIISRIGMKRRKAKVCE